MRGDDAGKMRGATGGGNDYLGSARFGSACELRYERRSAVGRHDLAFVRHAELIENFGSGTHRLPIRFAAHDYCNKRFGIADCGLRIITSFRPSPVILVIALPKLSGDPFNQSRKTSTPTNSFFVSERSLTIVSL